MSGKPNIPSFPGIDNSAFDICGALWETERAVDSGITTEKADLILASIPYRMKKPQPPATPAQSRTSFSASLGTAKDARKIGKSLFPVHRKATISSSAASKV